MTRKSRSTKPCRAGESPYAADHTHGRSGRGKDRVDHTYGETITRSLNGRTTRAYSYAGLSTGYLTLPVEPVGLDYVDHCVGNVELGKMNEWVKF